MDKMDMFGYRYIKGYDTISKYMTIEKKKMLQIQVSSNR